MRVLVTGATGRVGGAVVAALRAAGVPVRASSRRPGPPGTHVDLDRPETLPAALDGVGGLFLYAHPAGIAGVLAAARAAGVGHVVLLSTLAVTMRSMAGDPLVGRHLAVERALAESGLPHTVLRPGAFAANALRWAPQLRATGTVRLRDPGGQRSPIHERDVAAVAARVLADGRPRGTLVLTGPQSLTGARQVELIGAAVGRRWTVPAPVVGRPAPVTDTVHTVLGRPALPFATWAADHAGTFRPVAPDADACARNVESPA